jgi:hypothetical protein
MGCFSRGSWRETHGRFLFPAKVGVGAYDAPQGATRLPDQTQRLP